MRVPRKALRAEIIQPDDVTIRYIPLTKSQIAVVDAEDYEWLMQWNWHFHFAPNTKTFYAVREIQIRGKNHPKGRKRTLLFMHVAIFKTPDGKVRDHANRNTLDNRRDNLRIASFSQNGYNCRTYKNNKSGHKGIWRDKESNKWMAVVYFEGLRHYVGRFDKLESAVAARSIKEKQIVGNFVPL